MGGFVSKTVLADNIGDLQFAEITFRDLNDHEKRINDFDAKLFVIVNVASKCGLAKKQYHGLTDIYNKYHDRGLQVIAFPTLQTKQEFSSAKEIEAHTTCQRLPFPTMAPLDVNGPNTHPIYQFLKHRCPKFSDGSKYAGMIGWNFGKFLVSRDGHVLDYYGPRTPPSAMEPLIESFLQDS